jgi:hypothetical protein
MCTVAVVDTARWGRLVAMNRDELRSRAPAVPPAVTELGSTSMMAPRDAQAGGTWIAVNAHGLVIALLNRYDEPGSLERAVAWLLQPPVGARSRGRLIDDVAECRSPPQVAELFADHAEVLQRTQPFDLIAAAAKGDVLHLGWDGATVHTDPLTPPALLVSAARDLPAVRQARSGWLPDLVATVSHEHGDPVSAMAAVSDRFAGHLAGKGPLGICMHRDEAGTVSHTQVWLQAREAVMRYQPGHPCDGEAAEVARLPLL